MKLHVKRRALRKRYGHSSSAMTKRFTVTRIRLDRQGYTSSGRYYGTGAPLFSVLDNETEKETEVRAPDAKAAREKVMIEIFGPPPKNSYMGEAKAISNAITVEMNAPGAGRKGSIQQFREKLNAVTGRLRPLTAGDRAWEYYDKDMDAAADNEAGNHIGYALGKLRSAAQMIAGAADRLKT